MKVARPWTPEHDAVLAELHGTVAIVAIAERLGRSRCSVRARITRLGIAKREYWTAEDEAALRSLYTKAGADGVLGLEALAREMGRDAGNLSRKAKELGLPTSSSRRLVEVRKDRRKFATEEELRTFQSESAKRRIKENGHPRGALGMRHSSEALAVISEKSKACWAARSEEEREAHTAKMIASKIANGSTPPQIARGTWMAGWREIGGKRNYYRSRWEANYARYLQWLKDAGHIKDWAHEPEVFWFEAIRRGVRSYKPDFRVWENDGSSALHEVKGWMDSRSKTCLARMAKYYPQEKLILIDGSQYRAIRIKVMRLVPEWEDNARDSHA